MLLAAACLCSCATANSNEDILFMFNGDENPCASTDAIILDILGGEKAHQFAIVQNKSKQSDTTEDLIAYVYGGKEPADADAELAMWLHGGDSPTLYQDESLDQDILSFLYGAEALATPPTTPELVADDVALMERNQCLHALTEWSPSESYSKGLWMLDQSEHDLMRFLLGGDKHGLKPDSLDSDLALFVLGGDENDSIEDALFVLGGDQTPIAEHFVDHVDSFVVPEVDIVDLMDAADASAAADSDLALFMLGGEKTDSTEDALFVLGGDQTPIAEHFVDIVESSSPAQVAEASLVEIVERHDAVPSSFRPMARAQALPPAPYEGESNEDCSDHECIARTVASLQAQLGISDAQLENGMIWGEDLVTYCMWQGKAGQQLKAGKETNTFEECNDDESKACPTSRVPPLPTSYGAGLRPPSVATCRAVLNRSMPPALIQTGSH